MTTDSVLMPEQGWDLAPPRFGLGLLGSRIRLEQVEAELALGPAQECPRWEPVVPRAPQDMSTLEGISTLR